MVQNITSWADVSVRISSLILIPSCEYYKYSSSGICVGLCVWLRSGTVEDSQA